MQKKRTDRLFIAGLYIVAKEEYINERYIQTGKFLDWVAVENISSDSSLDLVDVNGSKTKYYGTGFEKGDLYIDYETLSSYTSFTNKSKLDIEEINFYLKQYKKNRSEIDLKSKRMIYEMLLRILSEIEQEKANKIINEILCEFGEEETEPLEIIEKVGDTLGIKRIRK